MTIFFLKIILISKELTGYNFSWNIYFIINHATNSLQNPDIG